MRILDRYVLSSFVVNYLICFFVLVGLFVVVDAFERFENMKEFSALARDGKSPAVQLATYYLYSVPLIFIQIAPAITLMAAMFTVTRLAKSGEIVPMKASGISLYRVIAPILVVALLLAIATVGLQEFLVPRLAPRLLDLLKTSARDRQQYHAVTLQDDLGAIYFIERFYPHDQPPRIEGLRIVERYPEAPHRKRRVLKATQARWTEDEHALDLSHGVIDEYRIEDGRRKEGYPVAFVEGCSYRTSIRPIDIIFTDQETLLSFQSLAQLRLQAERHPGIAPVQVEIASRFTRPLAHLILLFLGLPFVLGKETKNFFLGAGFAVVISGAYFFVMLYATKLGYQAHIRPIAAAWTPVLVFGSLGAGLLDMIRT